MTYIMSSSKFIRAGTLGAIVFVGLGSLVEAQTAKSSAPAPSAKVEAQSQQLVDAEPTSTVASFGDWVLRCQRTGSGSETQRVCEVAQQIRTQEQQTVAELAIGRVKKSDSLRLTMVLPVNVTMPNPPTFAADGTNPDVLDLGWRKCLPGGCIADTVLKDDALGRWKAQTGSGRITWKDATGRDLAIGISFRGLSQALDALGRQF